jgi:hypothetical protein
MSSRYNSSMIVATSKIKIGPSLTGSWLDFYDIKTDEYIGSYDANNCSFEHRYVDPKSPSKYSYDHKILNTLFDVLKFIKDNEDSLFLTQV